MSPVKMYPGYGDIPKYPGKNIIEIMGDSTSQCSHAFQPVHFLELFFSLLEFSYICMHPHYRGDPPMLFYGIGPKKDIQHTFIPAVHCNFTNPLISAQNSVEYLSSHVFINIQCRWWICANVSKKFVKPAILIIMFPIGSCHPYGIG